MTDEKDLEKRAKTSISLAEKMLFETYPVVNDPRLILAIADDIYTALMSCIEAVSMTWNLRFGDDFESGFSAFKERALKDGFTEEELDLVMKIHNIVAEHKKSPVEFTRKGRFVICDEVYNCTAISSDDMKSYLFRARLFVEKVEGLLRK